VLRLIGEGFTHRQVQAETGIPLPTIRGWARGRRVLIGFDIEACPRCGAAAHDYAALPQVAYAYLLGVYLGDGHLVHQRGRSYSLRIALDLAYPGIIAEVGDSIEVIRGRQPWVGRDAVKNFVRVVSYWRQWPCLFPQHGPGRKHHRAIRLAEWQRDIVGREPGSFLRGLIHTDGWRGLNRVHVKGRDYAYPRYQFSNRSDDIRRLFTDTCDLLEIEWRRWGRWHISVAKRDSVACLDQSVGLKS
jgi:hypothetical protein